MKKLRVAVIGVGYLGRFHAQKYKSLSDDVELVSVCDMDADRARTVAEELGVSAVSSVAELFDRVDAVVIAASTRSHFSVAKQFLSQGVHVFVEKPMTATVGEAEELVQLAREKSLKLQVGHVERFNAALTAAKEQLGIPLFIECHRLAPFKPRGVDVDVVLDLMIHDLDVILSLVKSPVVSVSAVGAPVLTKLADIANARIEFESGAVANVTASRVSQNATRKFRVFQTKQYLSIDFGSGEVNLTTLTGDVEQWQTAELSGEVPLAFESWNLQKTDALLEEAKSFISAIQNDRPVLVSGEDGLIAMRLADRIRADIYSRLEHHMSLSNKIK